MGQGGASGGLGETLGAHEQAIGRTSRAGAAEAAPEAEELPALLGVPESLRAWWARTDPAEVAKETARSGRSAVLLKVAKLLRKDERVLDLGCGPGCLAKEAGRRDIMGVDMVPAMLGAARQWMDATVPDNMLEYFPEEAVDAVVLCNVLEPYTSQVRRVLFAHCCDFLRPGGRVVIVASLGGAARAGTEGAVDLVFPTCSAIGGDGASPEALEEELASAGLELVSTELLETRAADVEAVPGDAVKAERRSYALLVARTPRS